MAGIDKIYGTQVQFLEFKKWLNNNQIPINCRVGTEHNESGDVIDEYEDILPTDCLYEEIGYEKGYRPISNFPENIDKWLIDNCPIDFVKNRLKEQYGK